MTLIESLLSPASVDLGFFKAEGPVVLMIPSVIAAILLASASLVWLYRDARKRDKHGLLAILFVMLTGWPASFIWWFWLRPPLPKPVR
jgi:hypothetical protein